MNSLPNQLSPATSYLQSVGMAVVWRSAFLCLLVACLAQLIDLGTSAVLLSLAGCSGVVAATRLAFSRLKHAGFAALCLAICLAFWLLLLLIGQVPLAFLQNVFAVYALELHLGLAFAAFILALIATWAFWKSKHAVTVETIALIGLVIYALGGHRNFHFESPQVLNSLAWRLGLTPLGMLVTAGLCLAAVSLAFLFWSAPLSKPKCPPALPAAQSHRGNMRLIAGSLAGVLICAILLVVSKFVHSYYDRAAMTRAANGVGQGNTEQVSPLGFHSALGGSNQPSALVRLEGDYTENPFSPMLYLRESALSQFNGRELVMASRIFDQDVSNSRPDEPYRGIEDAELLARTPLVQSIYLLGSHKVAFAVDYPVTITQLKNPQPSRFKGAYRAYSVAPGFTLSALRDLPAGDARWSDAARQLYLTPHTDPRYQQLAQSITAGLSRPAEKAAAIVDYLSKNAIYTLTPGHEVDPKEDPVAPFLFGDLRGYCVHFAHATVYLLRAVGIPARIGTGYLTDLSQSKDGHILLRMSDRHAWAEVYIQERGWIPFDTKPERVESHAETPVDMKLLEELMGLIGPGEEILPKDIAKGELNLELDSAWRLPDWRYVVLPVLLLAAALLMVKMLLLYGWLIPGPAAFRLRRSYAAILCRLYDLGYRRFAGETREEFRRRMSSQLGEGTLELTALINQVKYSAQGNLAFEPELLVHQRNNDFKKLKKIKRWKRALAAINPASTFSALSGGRW